MKYLLILFIALSLSLSLLGQVPAVNSGTATYPASGTIMIGGNNLSEITTAATARTNLGLGSASTISSTCSGTDLTGTLPGCTVQAIGGKAVTLGGNFTTTGAFNTTFAQGASTTQTLPTTSQTIPGMNQVNTAGASFTLDMSAASPTIGHKVPVAAGAAPTANGALSYDSTANGFVGGVNGTANYFPLATKLLTFTGATAARSIALPVDGAFTIARQDAAQTFTGLQTFSGIQSAGTKFTASGCSNSTTIGGAISGKYTSGTTGTCTVVITMNGATGLIANNGWDCSANDLTTPADKQQTTTSTTTTATISGTTVSGDVISFHCMAF